MLTTYKLHWFIILIEVIFCRTESTYIKDNLNVPCSVLDTVDLTGAIKLSNGTYLHEGYVYPQNMIGFYDYVAENISSRRTVKSHLRGCLCKIKSCVKVCCKRNQYSDSVNNNCFQTISHINPAVELFKNDEYNETIDLYQNFATIMAKPCSRMYPLDIWEYPDDDEWRLYENGTIFMVKINKLIPRNEYCLSPIYVEETGNMMLSPFICAVPISKDLTDTVYSYALFFSVPFMIITIAVYTIVPELRNLHGKSLSCYLMGLVFGYSILGYILSNSGELVNPTICGILGYGAYFFFMASFFWLSVISFDLWWNFRGTRGINKLNEHKRFVLYSLYSWGFAALFLTVAIICQNSNLPAHLKPGINDGKYCWLNVTLWVILAYFYLPIIIIIFFNTTMYIMTSLKIYRVQKEMSRIMARQDSRRSLHNEKDKFGLFLRLFIVMGITWSMEIIAWLIGDKYSFCFYVSDICNAAQGFLIFVFFVLKQKVKNLIIKRYRTIRGISTPSSQNSSKTNSSHMAMTSLNFERQDKHLMTSEQNKE